MKERSRVSDGWIFAPLFARDHRVYATKRCWICLLLCYKRTVYLKKTLSKFERISFGSRDWMECTNNCSFVCLITHCHKNTLSERRSTELPYKQISIRQMLIKIYLRRKETRRDKTMRKMEEIIKISSVLSRLRYILNNRLRIVKMVQQQL